MAEREDIREAGVPGTEAVRGCFCGRDARTWRLSPLTKRLLLPIFSDRVKQGARVSTPLADRCVSHRRNAIRRPMRSIAPVQKEGPRVNQEIRVREVQLIDGEGNNRGVVPIHEAIHIAEEAGMDLVEIAPNSVPPVCKLLDFGRFKYQSQKKAAEARKKTKTVEVKEIKMRPGIDVHDYDVKMKSMRRFFEEGDKVKVTLRFRGREMAHQDLGLKLLQKVKEEVVEQAKVETEPSLEGRQMVMILAPR
jgi:translation initiation factor IF-3